MNEPVDSPSTVIPLHLKHVASDENMAKALEAPEGPGATDDVAAADPTGSLDPTERELARLRLLPISEVVKEYIGTRDNLDHERAVFKTVEATLKSRLEMMSMVMREKADALGVDAFPIRGVGTAYRNVKTSYRINDWTSYIDWIIRTGNTQCLEKRAAKLAVAEVEKHVGALPPGIDKVQEVEFLVRRNNA